MRNVYKNMNVFKCVHEAHDGFDSKMSVHHILKRNVIAGIIISAETVTAAVIFTRKKYTTAPS
jgi:hypothetical protein